MSDLEISGGAGPAEAAAIVAVVQHVLETEAAQQARPVSRPDLSLWVLSNRAPTHGLAPVTDRPLGAHKNAARL